MELALNAEFQGSGYPQSKITATEQALYNLANIAFWMEGHPGLLSADGTKWVDRYSGHPYATTGVPKISGVNLAAAAVAAIAIAAAGSGGTNGTYALAFTGGSPTTPPAGTFTVAGGVVTAYSLTNNGAGHTSVPTISTAACPGLSGASLIALLNVQNGQEGVVFGGAESIQFGNINPVSADYTKIYVVNPAAVSANALLAGTSASTNWNIDYLNAGHITSYNGSNTSPFSSPGTYPAGTPLYAMHTFRTDTRVANFYVGGAQIGSATVMPSQNTDAGLQFGHWGASPNWFLGVAYAVMMFNRDLSQYAADRTVVDNYFKPKYSV